MPEPTQFATKICACGHIDAVHGGWVRPDGSCGQSGCRCGAMQETDCLAMRYSTRRCSEVPAAFEVAYANSKGEETDCHPACFVHGIAEVDRHHASAGMSRCDMRPRQSTPTEGA